MLVELTQDDGQPICFNPLSISTLYPIKQSRAGDDARSVVYTIDGECWRVNETFIVARQHWIDALGH